MDFIAEPVTVSFSVTSAPLMFAILIENYDNYTGHMKANENYGSN